MPEPSLGELLTQRLTLLRRAPGLLRARVKAAEKKLITAAKRILRRFSIRQGRIVNDVAASDLLLLLRRQMRQALSESGYATVIDDYLPRFDQVEQFEGKIYGRLIDGFKMPDTRVAKRIAVETVVSSLRELGALEAQYLNPLIRTMWEMVEQQVEIEAARRFLESYIVGTSPSGGQLAKYSSQITTDLLNGYQGYLQIKIKEKYNLDGWYYLGALVDASRDNCIHLLNGTGWFEKFAIKPGLYASADIPEIVEVAAAPGHNGGWRPETTAETFPIHRCGYRCGHSFLFVGLTDDESLSAINKARSRFLSTK